MALAIPRGYLFALGAVLIWSGFILVSRMGGLSALTSYDVIAIRYLTCSTLLLPFWLMRHRFPLFQRKLLISSLFGGLGYALFAFKGFELTPASHTAVLLPGLMPLFIALLAFLLTGERHSLRKWLGTAIITGGIATLFWKEFQASGQLSQGHIAITLAGFCWSVYSVMLKRWQITPWQATVSLAFLTCLVYLPVYLLWLPKTISIDLWQQVALQAFYQGFLATIVQMMLYVKAVQMIGPASMGGMMAIVPILAGFSAIPVFNESVSTELLVGLALVSFGVWFSNKPDAPAVQTSAQNS